MRELQNKHKTDTNISVNNAAKLKRNWIRTTIILYVLLIIPTLGTAQLSSIVGADGTPLPLRRGMTIAQAVQALRPEYQSYALGGDSGWLLQIHENDNPYNVIMTLWSDEFEDYVVNYAAKLKVVIIHSPKFKTKGGVHVGMLLSEAEKKLGKLKYIYTAEPTFEEFAEFARNPDEVAFGVSGGIFEEGQRKTERYLPDARITKIQVAAW